MNKTKNKFTFKIIFSYLTLGILALVVGYFITSEIKVYVSTEIEAENDSKLLKTGSLLTELYQAESLSKLALQKKSQKSFTAYTQRIDSIFISIDSLKLLTDNNHQKKMLDSVQGLLQKKVFNSNELLRLKRNSENNNSIDNALLELTKIEQSMGKLPPESFNPNYADLPEKSREILKTFAEYLSENVPKDEGNRATAKEMDSIITASKLQLEEAKQQSIKTIRNLAQKEMELNRADLEISQQLRSIISAFEQEVLARSYIDNLKKQEALNRSIRLAGFAALLGFAIVALFTFFITKDYWKVQLFRQQLEKEKKYSESLLKSREQLIATVSHDLRTPLNTITGYSELMETTGLTGLQVSYLRNVKSASNYVDSLVNDLLDFSKLEAGKIKIEKSPFILADLITETAENLRELNSGKKIALQLDLDERLKNPVLGDAFRIRQILTNLIGNAYKFTAKGYIKITAKILHQTGDSYSTQIQIIDSGIGIKKEKQEQIFKEFTQADDHTDKKYGGYGLGLTISKKITELLDGKINLKSEEGKGSTFTLEIPFIISTIPVQPDEKIKIHPQAKLSLLILDDDPAMLKLLKEVCLHLSFTVKTYNNFYDIEKNIPLEYDVILTDIQMPNISGFEVLEKLQKGDYKHYKGQPIVAMTGRKDLKRQDYLQYGFADIMQKPFAKDRFIGMLGALFPSIITKNQEMAEEEKISSDSNLFSLEVITSFLGDDKEAVAEVLNTFITDTAKSLEKLKEVMATAESTEINAISHKMLPMFRQLKAKEIIPILEQLETLKPHELTIKELQQTYSSLTNKVRALILAINAYLTRDPTYSG
ncbi:hybrid sensor histidine kinase/response regulator [Arenibacter certesii]|uniref:histidine kinase n=1 Tax=Arenibacter certesii TaxID=228955 RepID=A0A918J3W4_9FLAO|nr:ATP-binding protein [Arenibacter certesii]GGW46584.1 hybrid sensor histidine kinase/response regulator [Arenibacter certesii]